MIREKIKRILDASGLIGIVYKVRDDIIHKRYQPIRISYKGCSFMMYGGHGDFEESVNRYGCYEPLMMDKAIDIIRPGSVVLDIGCAEGYFSMFAAQLNRDASKIYGFDMDKSRSRIFRKNSRAYLENRLNLVNAFVSDSMQDKNFITIDHFLERDPSVPQVDVVKIDVEGAEVMVLKGMQGCIRRYSPGFLIEVHPHSIISMSRNGIDEMCEIFAGAGYRIELCTNHRGGHRGLVEPWREVTAAELKDYCMQVIAGQKRNFAIYCYRDR